MIVLVLLEVTKMSKKTCRFSPQKVKLFIDFETQVHLNM